MRARGQTLVWEMSATRKAVGSILLAAPMLESTGTPACLQRSMSISLEDTVSMQSNT